MKLGAGDGDWWSQSSPGCWCVTENTVFLSVFKIVYFVLSSKPQPH